ncbi:MAG: endonuclease/exonuclease/phosphatase family protein [Candidatus Beckwithbacteria bacterium]|nr:endonuclease/exonuclease/phosphatase family protein [Candidatus Beckwithbacteria bacterium]
MSLKLISLNIEARKHFQLVIPFLKKAEADIVCLQEVFQKDVAYLETALSLKAAFVPLWYLSEQENYHSGNLQKEVWGMAILSRLSLTNTQHQYYFGQAKPLLTYTGPGSSGRALLWTTVTKNHQSFTVANAHFTWAKPETADQIQAKPLQKLLDILKTIPEFVLCGDFNAPRGQKTWTTLASLYHDSLPLNITTTIDPQLHQAGPLQLVVDGLFSSPQYLVKNIYLQTGLSDHQAIIAEITKL